MKTSVVEKDVVVRAVVLEYAQKDLGTGLGGSGERYDARGERDGIQSLEQF
jgi:hypothetical protein